MHETFLSIQRLEFCLPMQGWVEKAMAPHSSTLARKIPWTAHGVAKSRTRLSNFTFTFHFHALEKEMATHSSGFLPGESQGWGRLVGCRLWGCTVGHDWSDLAAAAAGVRIRSLVWEDSTCHRATKPVQHNCWTCALEPGSLNRRSHRNAKPTEN